jgi:nucleoside-diphosphate-sugar epimerase
MLKRIVVTGANGFIGSHLCRQLVASGKQVTACIGAESDASAIASIPGLEAIYRMHSAREDAGLPRLLGTTDAVIHLAGRAHIMRETAACPLDEFRRVNVDGTEAWASLAAEQGVKRFIYISSIKVNGETTNGRSFEADDPPGYCDAYGQSKWEAEERLRQIASSTAIEWVIVRPPLVYGPEVRGNFLTLLRSVFRGLPLPVGSLHNRRSLISVFNLSDFICLLLDHPAAANQRFLISDQHDLSTPELLRRIAQAFDRRARVLPCPEFALHWGAAVLGRSAWAQRICSSLVVSTRKVEEYLGWNAPTTLDYGLHRTAQWFLKRTQRTSQAANVSLSGHGG